MDAETAQITYTRRIVTSTFVYRCPACLYIRVAKAINTPAISDYARYTCAGVAGSVNWK